MKNVKYLIGLLMICQNLAAQRPIIDKHAPQSGDSFFKQEVKFFDPGKPKKNNLWDFSRVPVSEYQYRVLYFKSGNGLTASDNESLYHYSFSGDSLFLTGEENPSTIIRYHHPQLLFTYPLSDSMSVSTSVHGKGKTSDRIEIQMAGNVASRVDGSGILILPGGDTLQQVMRVHISKKFTQRQKPLPTNFQLNLAGYYCQESTLDSCDVETDTYLWFVQGYRYPVLESQEKRTLRIGQDVQKEQSAFLFHPSEQATQVPEPSQDELQIEKIKTPVTNLENVSSGIRIYPNPAHDVIHIQGDKIQQIDVYDVAGKRVYRNLSPKSPEILTISSSHWTKGSYLIRIISGQGVRIEKIVKL